MTKRLLAFGKQFRPVPSSDVRVAIGPGALIFQKRHSSPIMVLPDDANPDDFTWPSDGNPGLIHERGIYDDESERWLRRIERVLRNGLPQNDNDVSGTIAHAHAMTEQALESIDRDWWLK